MVAFRMVFSARVNGFMRKLFTEFMTFPTLESAVPSAVI